MIEEISARELSLDIRRIYPVLIKQLPVTSGLIQAAFLEVN